MKIRGDLWVLGDTHNSRQTEKIIAYAQINNATVIHVGDGGIDSGWGKIVGPFTEQMCRVRNVRLILIRGNHDDPAEFPYEVSPFLRLVDDYTSVEWEDAERSLLLIGGGISPSRGIQTKGLDYWEDEPTKPMPDDLGHHDIVIAHDCPSWINKSDGSFPKYLLELWNADDQLIPDCRAQRARMDEIFRRVKPSQWWYGHYHNDLYDFMEDCHFQCVNINRLKKIG